MPGADVPYRLVPGPGPGRERSVVTASSVPAGRVPDASRAGPPVPEPPADHDAPHRSREAGPSGAPAGRARGACSSYRPSHGGEPYEEVGPGRRPVADLGLAPAPAPAAVPPAGTRDGHWEWASPTSRVTTAGETGEDGDGLASPRRWGAVGRAREALAAHTAAFDPGRPGLRVLLVLGVLAAIVAGGYVWRSRPEAEPLPPPAPANAPRPAAVPEPSPSASGITVYVTGKVRKPGVLVLPGGSRIVDAIEAAGGLRPGAKPGALNLARRLVDGEHITVGASSAAMPGGGPAGAHPAGPGPALGGAGGPIDLNLATAEELDQHLPGVGEVLARRIVEYREAHGGFRSVEQLRDVTGIGERRFAELKDKVRV